jgi:hypothetical protein
LGQSLAQFRRASEDFKRQWEDEVAIERQRIEPPPPAPIEHPSYSAAAATSAEGTLTSTKEEHSQIPTAGEAPVTAHHEETPAHETKRDWM